MSKEYYTTSEASRILGIDKSTIVRKIKRKEIVAKLCDIKGKKQYCIDKEFIIQLKAESINIREERKLRNILARIIIKLELLSQEQSQITRILKGEKNDLWERIIK